MSISSCRTRKLRLARSKELRPRQYGPAADSRHRRGQLRKLRQMDSLARQSIMLHCNYHRSPVSRIWTLSAILTGCCSYPARAISKPDPTRDVWLPGNVQQANQPLARRHRRCSDRRDCFPELLFSPCRNMTRKCESGNKLFRWGSCEEQINELLRRCGPGWQEWWDQL